MRLDDARESGNVEDRRGMAPVAAAGGGILTLVVMAVAFLVTGDPNAAKQAGQVAGRLQGGGGEMKQVGPAPKDGEDKFARQIAGLTEDVWAKLFPQEYGQEYEPPKKIVLFSEGVRTGGCGDAPSAVGPFYCPADRTVYFDPVFFEELKTKLKGSKADFSKAYVIAHEVGHHVQNLLGYSDAVRKFERTEGKNGGIRLELQADYLAGVWAYHANKLKGGKLLEPGDADEALTTAKAIGDDMIAKTMSRTGWPSPENFTHGTSAQRLKHFKKGLETGDASKRALDYFFDRRTSPLEL